MNKKLLSLYSLKYNPFSPQVPVEALLGSGRDTCKKLSLEILFLNYQ